MADGRRTGASPPSTSSTAASGRPSATYGDADGRPRRRPRRAVHDRRRPRTYTISRPRRSIWLPGRVRPDARSPSAATSATTPRRRASSPSRATTSSRARSTRSCRRSRTSTPADLPGRDRAGAVEHRQAHYRSCPSNFPANLAPAGRRTSPRTAHHAVREGARPAELVPRQLHLRPRRAGRPAATNAIEALPRRPRTGLLRAVRRHVRRLRPLPRPAGPGRRRLHAGRRWRPTALYHVEGKHAHAWPEVYFTGIGWVPFEPTPTRGAPRRRELHRRPAAAGRRAAAVAPPTTVAPATTVPGDVEPATARQATTIAGVVPPRGLDTAASRQLRRPTWLVVLASSPACCSLLARLLGPRGSPPGPRALGPSPAGRQDRRRPGAGELARDRGDVLARAGAPAAAERDAARVRQPAARSDRHSMTRALVQASPDHVTVAAYSATTCPTRSWPTDDARRELEQRRWSRADFVDTAALAGRPPAAAAAPLPGDHEVAAAADLEPSTTSASRSGACEPVSSG